MKSMYSKKVSLPIINRTIGFKKGDIDIDIAYVNSLFYKSFINERFMYIVSNFINHGK